MPVSTWRFKTEDQGVRHAGPMAQDFYAAFGLGEDERTINAADISGVALAAIQGLQQELTSVRAELAGKDAQLAAQAERIETLEAQQSEVRTLKAAVQELRSLLRPSGAHVEATVTE